MTWLDDITDSMDTNLSKLWEMVKDREVGCRSPWGSQRVGHDLGTKQQQSSLGDTFSLINQQKVTTADILFPCATSSEKSSRRKRKRSPKRDCSLYLYSLCLSEFVFSNTCQLPQV